MSSTTESTAHTERGRSPIAAGASVPAAVKSGTQWLGRRISFDHAGKRLVGVVERAAWAGYTERGAIPDWSLTIRGGSGALLAGVSLVEARGSFE